MMNTDPLIFARLASKFEKSTNMTTKKQNFFWKKSKMVSKTQNFTPISNPFKKLFKNAPKKSYKQNNFDEHE
jgi:hypothetical protein